MSNIPVLFVVAEHEVANVCGQCGRHFEIGNYLILVSYGMEVYFLGRPPAELLECCDERPEGQLAIFTSLDDAKRHAEECDKHCEEAIARGTDFDGLDIPLIESPMAAVVAAEAGIILSESTVVQ